MRQAERLWYLILSVACFIVILAGAVSAASVQPAFCGVCHGDQSRALAKSNHAEAGCDSCHTDPNPAGVIDSRLSIVGMVPAKLLFGKEPMVAEVANERCVECHRDILTKTITSRGLRMQHRAVQDENWSCTKCHPKTGHNWTNAPTPGYSMDMCLECHTPNTQDLQLCNTCHVEKGRAGPRERVASTTPWRVTHGPNWRQAHGMGNLKTCQSCHAATFCTTCHNMELPHPPSFRAQHGSEVKARPTGAQDCYQCHKGRTCENCHGIDMPHPAGFIKKHSRVVKRYGEAVCVRCHSKASCESCHTGHIHPGVPQEQLKKLRERPAL
ncbi:MAG: hypothetical protein C4521_03930 [Actinobacteria bacterium]|nr:MAG: hypothetical protein C4521_03930 [Actinomycetota bacterium]